MTLDIAALRASFPSLASGIAHFDGPGGTQTPTVVGAAIADTLTGPLSNRGDSIASERNAEHAISAFRDAMADLLGADPRGVVYGRSATQITYDFSRALAKTWSEGTRSWSRSSTTTATSGRGCRRRRHGASSCGGSGSTPPPPSSTWRTSPRSWATARAWSP